MVCSLCILSHAQSGAGMERGIQYLRELAVRELVYNEPNDDLLPTDADEVQCTASMWRNNGTMGC